METPQVEQTDDRDDRRAILEQGFDAAEKGEPIPSVARDEAGRFAPKPQEAAPVDPPADPRCGSVPRHRGRRTTTSSGGRLTRRCGSMSGSARSRCGRGWNPC